MKNFDFYRSALLLLVVSLLAGAARAQSGSSTPILTTDGTMSVADSRTLASSGAVSGATLKLSTPPAPEVGATFYDDSRKDLHQSLAWMLETNALAPTYWNLYTEARIRLKLKDYAGARTSAEQAYQLAIKAMPASQEYVLLSAAVVAKAHELTQR